jgi:serine/threonine protein kinase
MDHAVLETSSDRYVIQEYLAEGGMGAIYLGKKLGHAGFEKEVVLKQLLPEFTSEPQFIDLFLREARISASLDHEKIVHTIDLVAAGKDFFIVMEYVRGGDLRTLLRRAKRRGMKLSAAAGLFVGMEIADALGYAHTKTKPDGRPLGLIHRDVSPSNILLSGSGAVKLTDFGIAKASTHRSVFYRVKGKVGYMSPEQARGETIDHRSDLYSLAVCIYEALTGERLFVADLTSTASMIYSQAVPRVSEKRSGVPPELDQVMWKALALEPNDRYQSAGELQEALRRVAFRTNLMYSSSEMAAHLRDVCGSDPAGWLRSDIDEVSRGGGTELYDNSQASSVSGASGVKSNELPVIHEDWGEPSRSRRPEEQLSEGTQLTSIVSIEARAKAAKKRPRSAWEEEDTRHYPDGRPPSMDEDDDDDEPEEATRHYVSPPRRPVDDTPPPRPPDPPPVRPAPAPTPAPVAAPAPRPRPAPARVVDSHDEPTRVPSVSQSGRHAMPDEPTHIPSAEIPTAVSSRRTQRDDTTLPNAPPPARRSATHEVTQYAPATFASPRNRWILGALIAALLAIGIALGIILSDPGAEKDDNPAATAPK